MKKWYINEAEMPIPPRTMPRTPYPYPNRIAPPIPDPKAEPKLLAAEFKDIVVPRNLGTCSRVKLVVAGDLTPAIKKQNHERVIDAHMFGILV